VVRRRTCCAPDPALTPNAGLAAITELCDQLGVIGALDGGGRPGQAARSRVRGWGDFLSGLDRQRADVAGQQLTPVPGLASTTAAGLARRITPAQWQAVESA
jgi:hypothetical protein